MSSTPDSYQVRPAVASDYRSLADLVQYEIYVHRHLDWRSPLQWLGEQPYLLALTGAGLQGALACPPDPPGIAWLRLFGSVGGAPLERVWRVLLERALDELKLIPAVELAALSLFEWFESLLKSSGFINRQNIVGLEWRGMMPPARPLPPRLHVRPMLPEDLPVVQQVDAAAFTPLWQNSLPALQLAYEQSASSTVAELEDRIVGYQISTAMALSGHLARLAVLPNLQRQHVAYALVLDLLGYFKRQRAWRVTVNTQNDNHASLALYEKMGFVRTGDEFRVYEILF